MLLYNYLHKNISNFESFSFSKFRYKQQIYTIISILNHCTIAISRNNVPFDSFLMAELFEIPIRI